MYIMYEYYLAELQFTDLILDHFGIVTSTTKHHSIDIAVMSYYLLHYMHIIYVHMNISYGFKCGF